MTFEYFKDAVKDTGFNLDRDDPEVLRPVWEKMNNNWQPIDTCPKEPYQKYLVYSDRDMFVAHWAEDDYGREYNFWAIDDRKHGPYCIRGASITHWMPLPEPPK